MLAAKHLLVRMQQGAWGGEEGRMGGPDECTLGYRGAGGDTNCLPSWSIGRKEG